MEQMPLKAEVFVTPRQHEGEERPLPVPLSSPTISPKEDPTSFMHHTEKYPYHGDAESLSSRVATSFAKFGISPQDSTRPLPLNFSNQYTDGTRLSPPKPASVDSSLTDEMELRILSTADLIQLPTLPTEAHGKRLTSAEIEQMESTHSFESWEQAKRYLALSNAQLREVIRETRRVVDPRLPNYPLWVAMLVLRGLTYQAGLKAPLLIKTFVADHLRLAASCGELDGECVDTYLRQHGAPPPSTITEMLPYNSTRHLHAQANKANARQEKNHTTATKMSRPRTIAEYVSAHTLLDWFVEVEAYLEFLDMTAVDQINVVTLLFRGTIRKWWNRLRDPQKDAIVTWPLMKKLMITEFLPDDYISDFYEELRDIKQTTTVKEYNRKYYALIQDLPDLPPEIAYYHYVAGLKPKIHTFVKVLPSKTLQHAMRQAETFDEAFKDENPYQRRTTTFPQQRGKITNQPSRFNTTRQRPSTEKSTKDIKCYNCGKQGHYANKCTQPKKPSEKAAVHEMGTDSKKQKDKSLKGQPPQ